MPEQQRISQLQAAFRRMTYATILLFLLGVSVAVFVYVANERRANEARQARAGLAVEAAQGQQAKAALCALRHGLDARITHDTLKVEATATFLLQHPKGIPGIPVKLIRDGLVNDQRDLTNERASRKALSVLRCAKSRREP